MSSHQIGGKLSDCFWLFLIVSDVEHVDPTVGYTWKIMEILWMNSLLLVLGFQSRDGGDVVVPDVKAVQLGEMLHTCRIHAAHCYPMTPGSSSFRVESQFRSHIWSAFDFSHKPKLSKIPFCTGVLVAIATSVSTDPPSKMVQVHLWVKRPWPANKTFSLQHLLCGFPWSLMWHPQKLSYLWIIIKCQPLGIKIDPKYI